eukprot:jgi/Psemu1/69804/estExt_Genemark1.C_10550015
MSTSFISCEDRAALDDLELFNKYDRDGSGKLDRAEMLTTLHDVMHESEGSIDMYHVEDVIDAFDKDGDGHIDYCEFKTMLKYLRVGSTIKRRSVVMEDILAELGSFEPDDISNMLTIDEGEETAKEEMQPNNRGRRSSTFQSQGQSISNVLHEAIKQSKRDSSAILVDISKKIYPVRDLICIQDEVACPVDFDEVMNRSQLSFDEEVDGMDQDFEAAYPPSAMRCLALVSHNEMKSTMRQFVMANKNLLKKFRLTGTNSTMTMLKEVFSNEPKGAVMFGPACASGPLGGDAELVSLMVSGRIGGIFFFQDPMNAHPHRADIDCLVRQALVHNTMMAETPTSALMMTHCLRQAISEGKPEMIPSFFFSLESPSVAAYKAQQKEVVNTQKAHARMSLFAKPTIGGL